jgi:hypothetical protein
MRTASGVGIVAVVFGKSEKGQATIVARQIHEGLYKMKGHTGIYRNIYDYIADVVPDDGSGPFRATFTEIFEGFEGRQPEVGELTPVKFDKKKKVEFDRSALHEEWKEAAGKRKSGFQALAEAPPETDSSPDFSKTMAAIAAARAAGDLDEVARLKAEFKARQ